MNTFAFRLTALSLFGAIATTITSVSAAPESVASPVVNASVSAEPGATDYTTAETSTNATGSTLTPAQDQAIVR